VIYVKGSYQQPTFDAKSEVPGNSGPDNHGWPTDGGSRRSLSLVRMSALPLHTFHLLHRLFPHVNLKRGSRKALSLGMCGAEHVKENFFTDLRDLPRPLGEELDSTSPTPDEKRVIRDCNWELWLILISYRLPGADSIAQTPDFFSCGFKHPRKIRPRWYAELVTHCLNAGPHEGPRGHPKAKTCSRFQLSRLAQVVLTPRTDQFVLQSWINLGEPGARRQQIPEAVPCLSVPSQ
jgi:hypothetical protein